MLKCPNCNSEYREGYTICSDCKCELIEIPKEKEEIIPSGIIFNKFSKSVLLAISLFLGGSFIAYLGFTRGQNMAVSLSRPRGADAWVTPDGFVLGCTYTPVIMGVALIILSIVFSTVLFIKWQDKSN